MATGARQTLAGPGRAELGDRGSRFLALVDAAHDEPQARAFVARVERDHPDATHVCWAFTVGRPAIERAGDAGEPAGTAGAPILQALRTSGLADCAAAVVRWYGGVNLGRGGLIRAYGGAARAALAAAPRTILRPTVELHVRLPLARAGAVRRLLRPPAIVLLHEEYGVAARLVLRVDVADEEGLRERLASLGATFEPSTPER